MIRILSILFLSLFLTKCSSGNIENNIEFVNENSKDWPIFLDFKDYGLNDFWSSDTDSTLFYLLKDFDENNRALQLIDVQLNINSIYYQLNSKGSHPQISLDVNGAYGEQNLAGLGLSDDLLESIQGDSSESNNDGSQSQSDARSTSFGTSNYSARLNTFWEIDLWGKISNMNKYYRSNMLSQAQNLEYAKISLKAQFIKALISTININNEIEIIERNLINLKKIKEITENRIASGLSKPNEIHIASSNYFLYESNLLSKEIELKSILRRIQLLIGNYPSGEMIILSSYPNDVCDIESKLSSDLILRRPDVLSKREALNSSNSKLISNKKALFPSFSLTNSLGQSSSDLDNLFNPKSSVWNIGLNIVQPIFQSGRLKKNIQISQNEFTYSDIEYIESVMNAFYETENFLDLDKSLKEVQNKISLSVDNFQKAVDFAIRSYELGLVDLVYVLNLQQQLFNTQKQLENIIAKRYLNRIDLILALGGNFEY
tara:strand:- start:5783 stop:7246 length:1464 start_codon:yes stop_codon:yes gene_type:complete